jgi:hypothetical protein
MILSAKMQSILLSYSLSEMSIEIGNQLHEYSFIKLESLQDRCPASFFDENFQTQPMYYGKHYETNEKIFKAPYGIFDILDQQGCPEILIKTVRPVLLRLMEAFSIFFWNDQHFLLDYATKNSFQLYAYARERKFINYLEYELAEGEISFEPHKDISLFTFSFIPEVEVLSPNSEWFRYEDDPNAYAVWMGSQMEELTNNRIKSTIHRVRKFDSSNVLFFGKLDVDNDIICNNMAK